MAHSWPTTFRLPESPKDTQAGACNLKHSNALPACRRDRGSGPRSGHWTRDRAPTGSVSSPGADNLCGINDGTNGLGLSRCPGKRPRRWVPRSLDRHSGEGPRAIPSVFKIWVESNSICLQNFGRKASVFKMRDSICLQNTKIGAENLGHFGNFEDRCFYNVLILSYLRICLHRLSILYTHS